MNYLTEVHYTPRELEVIKYLLMRFTIREIAFTLSMADFTVYSHIKHLLLKTCTQGRANLNVYLLSHDFSVNSDGTVVTYKGRIL